MMNLSGYEGVTGGKPHSGTEGRRNIHQRGPTGLIPVTSFAALTLAASVCVARPTGASWLRVGLVVF